jgi:CelD/BcsL family acetyltransferase involved in cellulose biosynthesis
LRGRIIPIANLTPPEQAAWRDLAARSVEPNPFFELEFVVPACRYLPDGRSVALVVAEEAGRFHACLPMRYGPLAKMRCSPAIGSWLHLYSFLGTPLVSPEGGAEAMACLLRTMRRRALWPRIVVLGLFGDDGAIASYLRRAAGELGLSVHMRSCGERAVFDCQDGNADALAQRVKRERRTKARQWRRLCEDWGEPVVVDRAGECDGAEAFLAIEASGWKGRTGTALASRAADAAFYREVTDRFRDAGRLHLYSLQADGNTLAMQTNLRTGSALFDWKVAYDERFASYSPGAQLQLQVLGQARGNALAWIDSCSDVTDEHQLRLSAQRRRVASLVLLPDGRLAALALEWGPRLIRAGRKLIARRTRRAR